MEKAHKKLRVWQESMALAKLIYKIANALPPSEQYGLSSQLKRSAVSIPSNIAEGTARQGTKEAIQFYMIARGSLSEMDTQIELCRELDLLSSSEIPSITNQISTVDSLLSGLIRYKRKEV